jgi:hypothetical protein
VITYDASFNSVILECDSPGCMTSHTIVSPVRDNGRSAMNTMTEKMAEDGWFMRVNGVATIEHLCPRCGVGIVGFQPVSGGRRLPPGSADAIGVVSAQDARRNLPIDPKNGREVVVRKARSQLGDFGDADIEKIRSMINRGKKAFGDG